MAHTDVLYCIEHVARELNVASAVSSTAHERHGLNVHVHVLSGKLDPVLDRNPPGLIAVPFCVSRRHVARAVLERFPSVPIVNLACEQLLSRGNRRHRLPKDELARKQVIHAAAGKFFVDWLIQVGVTPQHIELVGSLPFQLYRDPYRRFFECKRAALADAHGLDPERPWVLLPENFGAAFFSRAKRRKRLRGGYRRSELREYVRYATTSFREISKWCGQAARLNRAELIIRPRPAMSREVLTEAIHHASGVSPHPRLHVVKDGTIQEWILASEVVVSSYSTTLLEAAVAGKPARMLAPVPVPHSAASNWHAVAPSIRSVDAFLDLVRAPAQVAHATELERWAEENLLSHGDAIQNVARLFAEICLGEREAPIRSAPARSAQAMSAFRGALSRPERVLRSMLMPRRRAIFGHECDLVERSAINERVRAWAQLLEHADQHRAA